MLRTIFYCVCFFHFVSYSIQALFTQRGRLPSTSLSLRGLTYAEVRVIQVLASRVLKKHEYETLHTQTTSYTLILYVDFSALLFVFFFFSKFRGRFTSEQDHGSWWSGPIFGVAPKKPKSRKFAQRICETIKHSESNDQNTRTHRARRTRTRTHKRTHTQRNIFIYKYTWDHFTILHSNYKDNLK